MCDSKNLSASTQVLSDLLRGEINVHTSVETCSELLGHAVISPRGVLMFDNTRPACRAAVRMRSKATHVAADTLAWDQAYRLDQQQHLQRLSTSSLHYKQAHLEKQLLRRPPNCLVGFPYLHSRTWTFSNGGRGHLVFTDGHGLFAVIVVQYTKTQNNRSNLTEPLSLQASHQGQTFARRGPTNAVVLAGTFTEQHNKVYWIPLEHQLLKRVWLLVNTLEDLHCENQRYPVRAYVIPTRQTKPFSTNTPNISEQHSATCTTYMLSMSGHHSATCVNAQETSTMDRLWFVLQIFAMGLCGLFGLVVASVGLLLAERV